METERRKDRKRRQDRMEIGGPTRFGNVSTPVAPSHHRLCVRGICDHGVWMRVFCYATGLGEQPGEAASPLIDEPWFIATVVTVVGVIVWAMLCLFSVWIYRRHRHAKKIPKNRSRPGQSTTSVTTKTTP